MPVWFAILVLIFFTSLGFGGGLLVGKATTENKADSASDVQKNPQSNSRDERNVSKTESPQQSYATPSEVNPHESPEIIKGAEQSRQSLNQIIEDIKKADDSGIQRERIKLQILNLLGLPTSQEIEVIPPAQLNKAIKKYQKENTNMENPDGEITLPKDPSKPNKSSTFFVLQCDVYKKLGITPPAKLKKDVCDAK